MNLNLFHDWRPKLFRVLQFIAPEGSSLDAVFSSYDDWRAFRPKPSATEAGNSPTQQPQSPDSKA